MPIGTFNEGEDVVLWTAVAAARDVGDSWAIIGATLKTTRKAAYQRVGRN
ncbi:MULTISPECIES: hypothetical protein [unclassified Nocardioides]